VPPSPLPPTRADLSWCFGRTGRCSAVGFKALAEAPWKYNVFVLIWCLPSNLALSVFAFVDRLLLYVCLLFRCVWLPFDPPRPYRWTVLGEECGSWSCGYGMFQSNAQFRSLATGLKAVVTSSRYMFASWFTMKGLKRSSFRLLKSSRFFRNVGKCLPCCAASHLRGQHFSLMIVTVCNVARCGRLYVWQVGWRHAELLSYDSISCR
jgi:hypothetical protein